MSFNPSKCEFLRITNKKKVTKFQYHIQGVAIEEVQHAKYLSITLNQTILDRTHIWQSKFNDLFTL